MWLAGSSPLGQARPCYSLQPRPPVRHSPSPAPVRSPRSQRFSKSSGRWYLLGTGSCQAHLEANSCLRGYFRWGLACKGASEMCCWSPSVPGTGRSESGRTWQRKSSCCLSSAVPDCLCGTHRCGRKGIWSSRWLYWALSSAGGYISRGPGWGSQQRCGWPANRDFC